MHNKKGFTLVEILVSASIFVVVVTIGFSMYTAITRLEQTTLRSQKIYTESRFWLDFLAVEIQTHELYYDSGYPSATTPEAELHLLDDDGKRVRYFMDFTNSPTFTLKRQIASNPVEVLSSPEIKITQLDFYITPLAKTSTTAPMVTIVWKAEELSTNSPVIVPLHTTVASRNY